MKKFKYQEIIDSLKKEVFPGMKPGMLLPGEDHLCHRYNVSAITIKKALSLLVEEGLVKRISGKGTVFDSRIMPQIIHIGAQPERTMLKVMTLNGWGTSDVLENVCRKYSLLHPEIEFEFHRISGTYYDECKIENYDLLLINTWMMREYLTSPEYQNRIIPLKNLPGLTLEEDTYFEECLKWCRKDGDLYCLPLGLSPAIAMFNMDYPGFKRLPLRQYETAAEYINMLYHLKCERQGSVNYFPFIMEISENRWPSFMKMMGCRMFDPVTGECTIDRPEVIAGFTQVVRLINDHIIPGIQWGTEDLLPGLFATGKIGCMWGTYKHLRANLQNRLPVKYQILPEPEVHPGHLLIEGLLVTENCCNPAAVGRFFNYLQSSPVQLAVCRQADTFTAQRELAELYISKLAVEEPTIMSILEGIKYTEPVVAEPRIIIWKLLANMIPKIWMGLDSVENLCHEIAGQYNRALNESRKIV